MWGELVYVGLGSMVGGMARHAVGCWFPAVAGRVPLATLAVNVGGCFVIGLANALLARYGQPSAALRLLLTTGFWVDSPRSPLLSMRTSCSCVAAIWP